jgi:hypothetical protein
MVMGLLKTGGTLALAAGALGLIAALATMLYVRTFGLVFLGPPRSERVADTTEATPGMRLGLFSLAGQLLLLSLLPAQFLSGFGKVLTYPVVPTSVALAVLGWLLWRWLRRWPKRLYNTWDMGHPLEARMQPSDLGYSELALRLFPGFALGQSNQPHDPLEALHTAISQGYVWLAGKFQGLQSGSIHLYLMLQFIALLVVLGVALR